MQGGARDFSLKMDTSEIEMNVMRDGETIAPSSQGRSPVDTDAKRGAAPNAVKKTVMMLVDACSDLFGHLLYAFDIYSDIVLMLQLRRDGHRVWSSIMLALILLPFVTTWAMLVRYKYYNIDVDEDNSIAKPVKVLGWALLSWVLVPLLDVTMLVAAVPVVGGLIRRLFAPMSIYLTCLWVPARRTSLRRPWEATGS